jgi:signal transduction histidine kinase/ActR/RegA family two-component response regulator
MTERRAPPEADTAPSAALLAAWCGQSHDLLALTDAAGALRWCNPAFASATGLALGGSLRDLAADDAPTRSTLDDALQSGRDGTFELALHAVGGAALWVDARVAVLGGERLWTLCDTTRQHELAARAQHLSELLDMAQEFGRLGVWEREIPSGKGRWDRHVFGFWGMTPSDGTPDFALAAARVHPDDRLDGRYEESTRTAGRYNARYRVVQPDGKLRWLHSQWEVKNSPQGQPDRTLGIMMDDTAVYELARSLDHASSQLRLAAELADIVIWRHDLQTDRLHYNDHGFKVLRIPYREDGLSLAEARSYTHPEDVHKLAGSAVHSLHTDGPVDVETRHRWPDGTWRHMLVRRVVERDASGKPVAFVGISLDVTDQVERTRHAEQMTRRLESAARAAHVGVWTTHIGTIQTEWNEQMYELFDRIDAGRPPPTLAEWLRQCVHPDDMARVGRAAQGYLKGARGGLEIEFRVVRRDESIRWVVLRGDIDRSDPQALRVFGIAMDVTDRHAAQAALHAVSERAALIARHAGIGTWEIEGANGPGLWDEQMFRLRGLEPAPTAPDRETRLALVHPDDREANLDGAAGDNLDDATTAYEFRIVLPDGRCRWLASRSAVLRDANGQVLRRVGVNWDITEAKNAELARQQAMLAERESEAKSQFLSRMSHELRTPLNAVLGFTQLLQLEARQSRNGGQAARLDHIRSAGEHLLRLIDNALDLSSLQSGTLALDLQAVPIACAIAQTLPLMTELAARHEVALHSAAPVATVRADPARLQQILVNLLSNAIQYNRPGGQVIVDGEVDGAVVRLNVRDTGRGMRADQLEHLFEPFNRLGAENDGIEGSGIGLTIVKALVEGMHGQIAVSSVPGRGSVFEVTLPLVTTDQDAAPPKPPETPEPSAPRARSGQLLYIEDNAVNVLLVEELVTSLSGLRLAAEATGADGVARARTLRPDLILIDMQLPDFDGFEVLRQLRQYPETAGISCIALSANAMPEDIERGLAAGFDDYWTKPIKFKPFLDALDRIFPPGADTTR